MSDELIARLVEMWRSVRMVGTEDGDPIARDFIRGYRGVADALDELVATQPPNDSKRAHDFGYEPVDFGTGVVGYQPATCPRCGVCQERRRFIPRWLACWVARRLDARSAARRRASEEASGEDEHGLTDDDLRGMIQ